MIEIQGIFISEEIFEKKFVCQLSACKGACCVEGDQGAPLTLNETEILEDKLEKILPFLDQEGKEILSQNAFVEIKNKYASPLKKDQSCAYSIRDGLGILRCGIENAYKAGATDFVKPISCHLYPIRISKDQSIGWEAVNYEVWHICAAACTHGEELGVPVFRFVKDALIRKYGDTFYHELQQCAEDWDLNQKQKTNSI